jgi:hypothetical protein
VFFMHSASAVDIYRAQRKHINYSIWPMRISRHDLRRRYPNSLVIDAGSQFSLRACSQASSTATTILVEKIYLVVWYKLHLFAKHEMIYMVITWNFSTVRVRLKLSGDKSLRRSYSLWNFMPT